VSARAYRVWRVDCDCGAVLDYDADEGSLPEVCEECGADIEVNDL